MTFPVTYPGGITYMDIKFVPRIVEKGWGRELIFAETMAYCGKILEFHRKGAKFSLHFHVKKDETWYVLEGDFKLGLMDLSHAKESWRYLHPGDTWRNEPLRPHRLECLSDSGKIIEVSTHDDPKDNYRIAPGDSQRG